jgi:hypothetical protein
MPYLLFNLKRRDGGGEGACSLRQIIRGRNKRYRKKAFVMMDVEKTKLRYFVVSKIHLHL